MEELSPNELLARIFQPTRATLEAAHEALRGITDPKDGWELLASRGVIPLEWIDDPRRLFVPKPPREVQVLGQVTHSCAPGEQVVVQLRDAWRKRAGHHRGTRRGCQCELCVSGREWIPPKSFRSVDALRAGDYVVSCGRFDVCKAYDGQPRLAPTTLSIALTIASDVAGVMTAEAIAREHYGDPTLPVLWNINTLDALVNEHRSAETEARATNIQENIRAILSLGYFVKGLSNHRVITLVGAEIEESEEESEEESA